MINEEQAKILKLMSELTGHVDMADFAKKTGLASDQILEQMQILTKVGLLKKVGRGFAVTEKGKIATRAITVIPPNMRFNFYVAVGQPTGASAGSVQEFRNLVLNVNQASLEFHISRGDFENWFLKVVDDSVFAQELAETRKMGLNGAELRKAMLKALESRYGL